jgi:DNA-binding GntR family transcriptional regulator
LAISKKQKVYNAIKSQILKMDLKPGIHLSDRKIARRYKVSRTPVREALTLLQQEDYVIQNQEGGFLVKGIYLKEIDDMYSVREALEVKALKLSYDNNFDESLQKLSRLIREHTVKLGHFNPGKKFLEGSDFHRALVRMCSNDYLIKTIESIYERLERLYYIEHLSREHAKKSHVDHTNIVARLEKQEYSEAEQLLSKHIIDSKYDFISRIKNRFEIRYY